MTSNKESVSSGGLAFWAIEHVRQPRAERGPRGHAQDVPSEREDCGRRADRQQHKAPYRLRNQVDRYRKYSAFGFET